MSYVMNRGDCIRAAIAICALAINFEARAGTITLTNLGPAVTGLTASVTSNSTQVTILDPGTNTFSAGQIIELFGAGRQIFSGSRLVVSNQDLLCLIQSGRNTTNGTYEATVPYPAGISSSNVPCVIGTNNLAAIQAAVNTAGRNNAPTTLVLPSGTFLVCNPAVLTTNYVMSSEFNALPGITLTKGGITFQGNGTKGTCLMTPGAAMNHWVATILSAGGAGGWLPLRSTLFWITDNGGTMGNLSHPLVFTNLTLDGGCPAGLTDFHYFPPRQSDGHGWDATHDAIIQVSSGASGDPEFCSVLETGCIIQHWRGEMVKSCIGSGGRNTTFQTINCEFLDGNASGLNVTFAQTATGCVFSNLVKTVEFDQHYATSPSVFSNLWWTNIVTNPFSIVGARANAPSQPILITGGTNYGIANISQYTLSPGCNITWSNVVFHGPSMGIAITAAGLQPNDGSASGVSNIVVTGCAFNDTFLPIGLIGGIAVQDVTVSNCTSASPYKFIAASGPVRGMVFSGNSGGMPFGDCRGITGGSFPLAQTNGFAPVALTDTVGLTNVAFYYQGGQFTLSTTVTNSLFYIDSSYAALFPAGASMVLSNAGPNTAPLLSAGQPLILLGVGAAVTEYWVNGAWTTNAGAPGRSRAR